MENEEKKNLTEDEKKEQARKLKEAENNKGNESKEEQPDNKAQEVKELDLAKYKKVLMVCQDKETGIIELIPLKGVRYRFEAKGMMHEAIDNYTEQRIIVNVSTMLNNIQENKSKIIKPN